MGSTSDRGDDTRDWKNGSVHMRIESHEARKSDSGKADEAVSADDSRNSTDDTNANSTARASGSRRQFPRLGLDALLHESQPSARPNEDGTFQFYKVYKRRWLGLAQLTLLNIIISWDWLTFSPVASISAEFFSTNESVINWMSTAFLFAFCSVVPIVIYVLHWGPKPSIVTAASLTLVGSWVRYGGVRASPPSFGVVMFGQLLIGFAQPFVLAAPTRYSDLWFTERGRVAATALPSLANPFGAALGQLIIPMWVYKTSDIPNAILYLAIIATVLFIPSLFVPAGPPTPASASGETQKLSLKNSVRALNSSVEFWLIFIPFVFYVGFFNSISTILSQVMAPYGFDDTQSGIAGAVLIVVGLISSAITSPILDRTKAFLLCIRVATAIIGLSYLIFIWMPATRSIVGPYVVLAILGAASFSLVPVATEFLVEMMHPVSPEVTSTLGWAGGQLLGALLIIISDALKAGPDADPPRNMTRALILQAVLALVVMPLPLSLGLFGRADKVILKRSKTDEQGRRQEGEESQVRAAGSGDDIPA